MTKMLLQYIGRQCLKLRHLPTTFLGNTRCFSSDQKYVAVEQDSEMDNVAIVTMQKKPVNSLCSDHLKQLATTFEDLASSKKYKAAILTSALPGIYSAGLDLQSIYGRTFDEIYSFWSSCQTAWITLYGNPLITVAGITGHGFTGGCLLALSCDHRVMAEGKYKIGLNEVKVGITPPFWMKNTMLNVVGFRETEKALQGGTMFSPSQAKEIGLVDVVTPLDQVIPSCRDFIKEALKLPYGARSLTKQMMREDAINLLKFKLHEDAEFNANFLTQDVFQKALEKYMQALGNQK